MKTKYQIYLWISMQQNNNVIKLIYNDKMGYFQYWFKGISVLGNL